MPLSPVLDPEDLAVTDGDLGIHAYLTYRHEGLQCHPGEIPVLPTDVRCLDHLHKTRS